VPLGLALWMRLYHSVLAAAPTGLPAINQFFLPTTNGRMACSQALLSGQLGPLIQRVADRLAQGRGRWYLGLARLEPGAQPLQQRLNFLPAQASELLARELSSPQGALHSEQPVDAGHAGQGLLGAARLFGHHLGLEELAPYMRLTKKSMTQLANRIHSIYKQNGTLIERAKLHSRFFREYLVSELSLPAMWMVQVCSLLNQFKTLEAEKKQLRDVICCRGFQLFAEEVKLLLGVHGFSVLTATALMADIVTVRRFSSAKKFCSYLRIAPRVQASNETVHVGRTTHQAGTDPDLFATHSIDHALPENPALQAVQRPNQRRKEALHRPHGLVSQGIGLRLLRPDQETSHSVG
jgi:hypothetical protein